MAARPGTRPPNAGKGRKKGVPNRATADVRMAFSQLLERNTNKLDGWLARVGKNDPARALDLVIKLAEYHIPKLSRTEVANAETPFMVQIVDPTRRDAPAA
jgi:hypothetical protein